MNLTAFLMGKAVAQTLAAIGFATAGASVQPVVWATAADAPPLINVFYQRDANRAAHRWQAAHWADYTATIMTSDGSITLDGDYERALIVTARIAARGNAEMRYAIPYRSDGVHISVYPIVVIEHNNCAYVSTGMSDDVFSALQQDVDSYGAVAVSLVAALPAQEHACNESRTT